MAAMTSTRVQSETAPPLGGNLALSSTETAVYDPAPINSLEEEIEGAGDASASPMAATSLHRTGLLADWHDMTGNVNDLGEVQAPEGWSLMNMLKPLSNVNSLSKRNNWQIAGRKVRNALQFKHGTPAGNMNRRAAKDHRKSASAPSIRVGRKDFWFGAELGSGAFARVVHAKRKQTGEEYAVKIMEKNFIRKHRKVKFVMMEKNVLSQLAHPNIVKLYFTFQDNDPGNLYMVMDLCYGELLHYINFCAEQHRIRKRDSAGSTENRALSLADTQFYIAEIVEALEYLHSKRIVHRDLKPENILLDYAGHVKIADFGTALDRTTASAYDEDIFCGTAQFVSPEVLEDRHATEASDLWAVGCIVFQVSCA